MDPSNLDRFHEEFWHDLDRSQLKPVEDYVRNYPDCAAEIEKAYEQAKVGGATRPEESAEEISQRFQTLLEKLRRRSGLPSRYTLHGEVGRGGMGAVLRVRDEELDRDLAMKVIMGKGEVTPTGDTPPMDPILLARFLDEAQITGDLNHPGIVPVHELGIDSGGRLYFTMRLVKGRDLKAGLELLRKGDPDWNQTRTLGLLLKACEAVAYAHSKGVIHRDLKPANIMVGRFGEVYVMDWGLAKAQGRKDAKDIRLRLEDSTEASLTTLRREEADQTPDSPLVTMDGDVVGTPAYMCPEQARGDIEHVGPRSDVYSMGAILYEVIAGRPPYVPAEGKVTPRTLLMALVQGPPEPVFRINRAAPAELVAICEKAMARDPDSRYADVLELAEDLRAFLEGRVVRAYQTGALAELRKWVRRNRALASSCCAVGRDARKRS